MSSYQFYGITETFLIFIKLFSSCDLETLSQKY